MSSTDTSPDWDTHGVKSYGLHPAQDAAIAMHQLRRLIRDLSNADESTPVGLGLAANLADLLADALDRYWWAVRPTLDDGEPLTPEEQDVDDAVARGDL